MKPTKPIALTPLVAIVMLAGSLGSWALLAPPAVAGGLINSCKSYTAGVRTHYNTPVRKKCGGWDGCLTSIVLDHDQMRFTVVDFKEPGFDGSLSVAVLSNDSRIMPGQIVGSAIKIKNPIGAEGSNDGTLSYAAGIEGWHKHTFTGLKPEHYYAVVIYNSDAGYEKPFYRTCFWTDDDPENCPADAPPELSWRSSVLRCISDSRYGARRRSPGFPILPNRVNCGLSCSMLQQKSPGQSISVYHHH